MEVAFSESFKKAFRKRVNVLTPYQSDIISKTVCAGGIATSGGDGAVILPVLLSGAGSFFPHKYFSRQRLRVMNGTLEPLP